MRFFNSEIKDAGKEGQVFFKQKKTSFLESKKKLLSKKYNIDDVILYEKIFKSITVISLISFIGLCINVFSKLVGTILTAGIEVSSIICVIFLCVAGLNFLSSSNK